MTGKLWETEVPRFYAQLLARELADAARPSPLLKLFAAERKPLTRWQRFKNRLRWYEIKYRVCGAWRILRHGDDE